MIQSGFRLTRSDFWSEYFEKGLCRNCAKIQSIQILFSHPVDNPNDNQLEALETEVSRIQEEIEALKIKDFESKDLEKVEDFAWKIAALTNQTEIAIQNQLSNVSETNVELDSRGRELEEFGLQFETVLPKRNRSSFKFQGSFRTLRKTVLVDQKVKVNRVPTLKFNIEQVHKVEEGIKDFLL